MLVTHSDDSVAKQRVCCRSIEI